MRKLKNQFSLTLAASLVRASKSNLLSASVFHFLVKKSTLIIKQSFTLPKSRLFVISLVALLNLPIAEATTRTVVNVNSSGAGSLRDTVAASIAGDTIIFAAGVSGAILFTNEITIARNLTIIGPGAAMLTLQGSGSRILEISSATANLSGLSFSSGGAFNAAGGAILNSATLTVSNCVFNNNIANGVSLGYGGAIYNSGSLRVTNCTFGNNFGFQGGAIYNVGSVSLNNCSLNSNRASDPSNNTTDTSGGAIYNNSGTVGITNCTFNGNVAVASGGAIYSSGPITIISSTFSGNVTYVYDGGALYNSGTLTLRNSTASGNQSYRFGSGLYQPSGTTSIQNTIIAGNTSYFPTGVPTIGLDVYGPVISQGHNFIGRTNTSSGWIASDLVGSFASPLDPSLGPLQNNGGQTWTMAPTALSAVIDAGDDVSLAPPLNLVFDQRGYPRRLGPHIDIGAVEADVGQTSNFIVTTMDDHDDGVAGSVDCTLREAINAANANADANTITFASNVTGVITLHLGELMINHDLNILGPGAMVLGVNGNAANRVFNLSSGTVVISGLAITNGHILGSPGSNGATAQPGGPGGSVLGGGIYNQATLTLSNCWISGNTAIAGNGGAGGSDDFNNQAGSGGAGGTAGGGGIYNGGSLVLVNCTINGNTATAGAGGPTPAASSYFYGDASDGGAGGDGTGGGVANAGSLAVRNCTVTANFVNGGMGAAGGSAADDGNGGAGGHGGNGLGGGLANLNNVTVASCTLSSNTVVYGAGGLGGTVGGRGTAGANGGDGRGFGGGLRSNLATNTVQNTLIAGNTSASGPDCSGTFTSQGYNLIGNNTGGTGFSGTGDQVGSAASPLNPQLGPLAYHGGPAPTMALLLGSPAIDKGNAGGLNTDQRGRVRPFDFPSVPNASDGADIGAFELNLPALNIWRSGAAIVISWPVDSGFVLQSAAQLAAVNSWTNVPETPPISGNDYTLTNNNPAGTLFYRLSSP
jgi:CSLREA domain-containing protein